MSTALRPYATRDRFRASAGSAQGVICTPRLLACCACCARPRNTQPGLPKARNSHAKRFPALNSGAGVQAASASQLPQRCSHPRHDQLSARRLQAGKQGRGHGCSRVKVQKAVQLALPASIEAASQRSLATATVDNQNPQLTSCIRWVCWASGGSAAEPNMNLVLCAVQRDQVRLCIQSQLPVAQCAITHRV